MTSAAGPEEIRAVGQLLRQVGAPAPIKIERLAAEASVRKYSRIYLQEAWQDRDTLILCQGLKRPYSDEDHFIELTRYLKGEGIPVPDIFAVERSRGWLLLGDAGREDLCSLLGKALESGDWRQAQTLLERALDLLGALQDLSPPKIVRRRRFDAAKLSSEIDFLDLHLERLAPIIGEQNRLSPPLKDFLRETCSRLGAAEASLFAHRDFHSRNIMADPKAVSSVASSAVPSTVSSAASSAASSAFPFRQEPVYQLIDFQDARMGTAWYDLASLLYDPYLSLPKAIRAKGLAYFINAGHSNRMRRAATDKEVIKEVGDDNSLFYLQALQRLLKALGSYLYLVGEKRSLKYISPIEADLKLCQELLQEDYFPDSCRSFIAGMQDHFYPALQEWAQGCAQGGPQGCAQGGGL